VGGIDTKPPSKVAHRVRPIEGELAPIFYSRLVRQPIAEVVIEPLREIARHKAPQFAAREPAEVSPDLPVSEAHRGMVKAGHEVNRRDQQKPRRECVAQVDAKSRRMEIEPVDTRAVLFWEAGADKINLGESNAGSKEEIVTVPHDQPRILGRNASSHYRE
jgi:hypothetical protein